MERLTERNSMGVAVYKTPYACGNCNEELYRLPDYGNGSPTDKLADYEDAEEQGLILRLPCPIGTTVYCIEDECEDIYIEGSDYRFVGEEIFDTWMLDQFGKTVFLTEEEAEQALKRMESE